MKAQTASSLLTRAFAALAGVALLLAGAPTTAAASPVNTLQLSPSLNWSGYAAGNAYYTGVSALIQAPQPGAFQELGVVASWVGIGGASSPDLIQAGVQEINRGPYVSYDAWYELLPRASRNIVMDVGPGDWLWFDIVEVQYDLWQITIVDGTQVFQQRIYYPSSHSSAEWIVEEPSLSSGQLLPLAGVTEAKFARMTAIANGVHAVPTQLFPQAMAIVSPRGALKATPTALGPDNASFSVTTAALGAFAF